MHLFKYKQTKNPKKNYINEIALISSTLNRVTLKYRKNCSVQFEFLEPFYFGLFHFEFYLPAIAGECASNVNPPSEKLRKSFSRSRCKSSCINRSSLPPPDVEPGLCWSDKLLGTGECVPSEISESESSEGVGDALSVWRERSDVPPEPESDWFIL